MPGNLSQTTAPASEPLALDEAKNHLRLTDDDTGDDARVAGLIASARQWCEAFTGRQLVNATWTWTLDRFPARDDAALKLPRPPLQSVSSVTYLDTDGVSQTWAASKYQVDGAGALERAAPARLRPVEGESWPSTQADTLATVTVTFVAGYGADWNGVPERLKTAMLLWLEAHYDRPERTMNMLVEAAEALAWPERLVGF